ncbi:hypothetical protein ACFQZX_17720 [Mucilaginibacter litoreus]|uniref:Uncharacterized protein n=1 Tax=Mucilaginibacter litoreus TaxID=1048221 RepID=A0ABW3AX69_9SPHI
MLNHLSWTSYFEAVALLLVIYYIFIGIRFYSDDVRKFFEQQNPKPSQDEPEQPGFEETAPLQAEPEISDQYVQDNYPDADIRETDDLIAEAKSLINAAANKAYSPESLIIRLSELFSKYTSLKISPYRPAINELVVSECERTGVAALTEDEVDEWWSD